MQKNDFNKIRMDIGRKIRKIFGQVVHKEIIKMALKCKKNVETHS